jgi:calcium-dependent protein kinase
LGKKKKNESLDQLDIEFGIEVLSNSSRSSCNSEVYSMEDFNLDAQDFIFIRDENFSSHYEIIKRLGEGTFGVVSSCKHLATGSVRACKQIKKARWRN